MKCSSSEISKDAKDLQFQLISSRGKTLTRSTLEAAEYDLYSSADIKVPSQTHILVSNYIVVQVPPGIDGRIASRSGLLVKNCIDISAGVIDKNYMDKSKYWLVIIPI